MLFNVGILETGFNVPCLFQHTYSRGNPERDVTRGLTHDSLTPLLTFLYRFCSCCNRLTMLKKALMKFVDREPVAAVALAIGIFGFSLPLIVPPIRKSMGYTTKQVRSTCPTLLTVQYILPVTYQ